LDVDPNITLVHKGVTIGFCSAECKDAFPTDPEKYINRYPHFKEAFDKAVKEAEKPAEKPKEAPKKAINTKCPVKGDAVKDVTFEYKGQLIGFC
jgi:hypothetical protein